MSGRYTNGTDWVALGIIVLIAVGIVLVGINYSNRQTVVNGTIGETASGENYFDRGDEFREQNVLSVDGTTITVGRGCTAIVADTSEERAEAIAMALENVTDVRPNTWDGWASMIGTFNVTFEAVTIYDKNEDAYLSRAIFRLGDEVLDLDMKPSDAIALALRTGTPIYLNMTLLREVGEDIC